MSLSIMTTKPIHIANAGLSYFSWLNNIHIYIYMNSHTHTYIYIYHILLIHSSTDGHLGPFHILAIVKNTAVIMGVRDTITGITGWRH